MHAELPVASFICAILVLIPLPWHWRAGTVATISITIWLFIANIINGVNSIIWSDSVIIQASIWCDITTKITVGCTFALPAALFCLCMHLERVSSIRQVNTSAQDKRRRQIIDGALCFGVPAIFMGLHYIVQGHRFDIVQFFGCRPTTYVSIPALFIMWIPPLLFSLGALVFAILAFRNFWHRRIMFARHLQNSNSALTPSRYFRLMSMSITQMLFALFGTTFHMWFSMKRGLRPWISWEDVHFRWSRVGQFPAVLIPENELLYTFLLWWTVPLTSFVFFAFFSFGRDAVEEYKAFGVRIKGIFFKPNDGFGKKAPLPSLPTNAPFIKRDLQPSSENSPSRTIATKTLSISDFKFSSSPDYNTITTPNTTHHVPLYSADLEAYPLPSTPSPPSTPSSIASANTPYTYDENSPALSTTQGRVGSGYSPTTPTMQFAAVTALPVVPMQLLPPPPPPPSRARPPRRVPVPQSPRPLTYPSCEMSPRTADVPFQWPNQ